MGKTNFIQSIGRVLFRCSSEVELLLNVEFGKEKRRRRRVIITRFGCRLIPTSLIKSTTKHHASTAFRLWGSSARNSKFIQMDETHLITNQHKCNYIHLNLIGVRAAAGEWDTRISAVGSQNEFSQFRIFKSYCASDVFIIEQSSYRNHDEATKRLWTNAAATGCCLYKNRKK